MKLLQERDQLKQQLSEWIETDPRRIAVLAELMLAIPLSRSLQSQELAGNIPRDVQDQSIAQMLRRFYINPAVTWEAFYAPLVKPLLTSLEVDVYYLVSDTTDVGQRHRALVISLAYQNRCLPLIWQVEEGSKGHTTEEVQITLLKQLTEHIQFDKPVIHLGDSEFDNLGLLEQLDRPNWYFACRTSPNLYIYPQDQPGFQLEDSVPQPDCPAQQWEEVSFTTKHQYGPVACYTCWESPHPEPLLLIYRLPPDRTPRETYDVRFWTDPLFADCKEAGFRLNTSRLRHADRLSRLLLAVAAAYLWMVCLGATVIAQDVADWVDRSSRRTLSIFKTGWRWFKRQIKLGRIVRLELHLPPDFELPELEYL